ncbi:Ldh family oxidoreductase [Rubritepida flocculans]|uniref:Ldh family oxidoreductase n=1 Tax=Rubritepida flocculans TaxID=182403 RepID=UPI0004245CB0|nr:Ldh family oxidoreductase [Rubritepida flocculans]
MLHATVDSVRAQIAAILAAWGAPPHLAETTAEVMAETDLMGVDSHGISMLTMYEEIHRAGVLRLAGEPFLRRDYAATALVDGADGLGHPAAMMAMKLAIEKARAFGIGAVGVVNSHHFGAAGCYARMAAAAGLMGLVTSTARGVILVPTRAAEPVLGTNPIAFAAPVPGAPPMVLDMATTTVAANKVKAYHLREKDLPPGWVVDGAGRPVTAHAEAMEFVFRRREGGITPLGGGEETGGHKGYGLALMVQMLAGALVGGSFSALRARTARPGQPHNIGHLMIALDPRAFRDLADYEADAAATLALLRETPPADPALPVLAPGDPEEAARAERLSGGIPIPEALERELREIAARAGAPFLLRAA